MRIALDLQACQTESRWRGIGRYSMAFTRALLQQDQGAEFLVGLDGTYPAQAADVREALTGLAPAERMLRYVYPGPRYPVGHARDALRTAAEAFIRQAYAERSPDVLHVHSLFEGYVEHAAGLGQLTHMRGTVSSVTLYDLIPQLFPERYLANDELRGWYRRKLRDLSRFDVILCISDSTRRDAVRLLGLPEERLTVIDAGVDPHFLAAATAELDEAGLRARLGIPGRFVLYTGNGDPRKNLMGAVEAFAAVPREARRDVQLVLNQVGDEQALRSVAKRAGLSPRDLVVTGRISDADLIGLLRICEVFFFPSLYEGFGLPVLEAMACGTAAICGNNSSLPEVIGREDALFDASSREDASAKLVQVLTDGNFRESLARGGRERAQLFSWDRTACRAMEAWENALQQRRTSALWSTPERRLRIALVTPLPPERTGIADYVVELLPALASRIDIDLYTSADPSTVGTLADVHTVRAWQELEARADDYDQVVYQMGNSPFHSHMIELLDRVPGAVVLHDFYLSSMLAYMDRDEGRAGLFAIELERSHGRGASALLATDDGWKAASQAFPASRRVLERADAVIVHSEHSAQIGRKFFPGLPRGPLVRVPMPRCVQPALPDTERQQIRDFLGVAKDDILIVSFGFLADTKLNVELLDALADPRLTEDCAARMVFVGQLDGGDYGRRIEARIATHPLRDRIQVTGFASQAVYRDYLQAADVAVQLRSKSRGETSKSVLDCLAHGLPVIVNNYGSFAELPDIAVAKIASNVGPSELADKLQQWCSDPRARCATGEAGRAYLHAEHAPSRVAAAYEDAIRLSMQARVEREGSALASRVGEAVASAAGDEHDLGAIEHALRAMWTDSETRLFIDLSEVVHQDYGTGIHRVVRNLARELTLAEGPSLRCVAVALDGNDRLVPATDYVVQRLDIPVSARQDRLDPHPGDNLFLLDSAWDRPERFAADIAAVREAGGNVYAMVYDLIPIRFPHYCVEFMPATFERWLRFVVASCDGLICISRAVADDLRNWISETGAAHRHGLRIGHIQLGSDVHEGRGELGTPSDEMREAMGNAGEAVLMVGTVEPRKRHDLALGAFEEVWAGGCTRRLVIVGKEGWNVEALVTRIRQHPQFGQQLFWLQHVSDAELAFAYSRAERVLQASDAEGFGLPLVEAARHGRPLLATDLAVFREVAGDAADYFPAGDVDALAACLRQPPRPASGTVASISWSDSATQTLQLIAAGPWDHVLS